MERDALRSTRSCSRARRSSERGIALILALVLAVLYFGLIELLLLDSARELSEARRFRARIVAETLAENGAELAALRIVTTDSADSKAENWQGSITGSLRKNAGGNFDLVGVGITGGITESRATVLVRGRVDKGRVYIQYTQHKY
jgi:Tfp pilus assembly protein PilX